MTRLVLVMVYADFIQTNQAVKAAGDAQPLGLQMQLVHSRSIKLLPLEPVVRRRADFDNSLGEFEAKLGQ